MTLGGPSDRSICTLTDPLAMRYKCCESSPATMIFSPVWNLRDRMLAAKSSICSGLHPMNNRLLASTFFFSFVSITSCKVKASPETAPGSAKAFWSFFCSRQYPLTGVSAQKCCGTPGAVSMPVFPYTFPIWSLRFKTTAEGAGAAGCSNLVTLGTLSFMLPPSKDPLFGRAGSSAAFLLVYALMLDCAWPWPSSPPCGGDTCREDDDDAQRLGTTGSSCSFSPACPSMTISKHSPCIPSRGTGPGSVTAKGSKAPTRASC
mmetsp:Transcript_2132/g.5146  ORF Transcript_2132/g.5146 Transcript_2132/m.5146 type:complete len:261 (-) Transcript_2132:347-1129(-)